MSTPGSSTPSVIVVGAGLAGLRCATDLVAAGCEVTVLEARPRVGGRVWSHALANGQWCERGAEFVDGAHSEVLALVASLGLELCDVPSGRDDAKRLLDVAGRPAPFKLHHSLADDLARFEQAMADLAALVDIDDPAGEVSAHLDALPLSALVEQLGLSLMARVVVGRDIRTEYMLAPDQVSQLMAAWMTALSRTLQNSDSLRRSSLGMLRSARTRRMSGAMPMERSVATECCVGLVLSSPADGIYGISVRCM